MKSLVLNNTHYFQTIWWIKNIFWMRLNQNELRTTQCLLHQTLRKAEPFPEVLCLYHKRQDPQFLWHLINLLISCYYNYYSKTCLMCVFELCKSVRHLLAVSCHCWNSSWVISLSLDGGYVCLQNEGITLLWSWQMVDDEDHHRGIVFTE